MVFTQAVVSHFPAHCIVRFKFVYRPSGLRKVLFQGSSSFYNFYFTHCVFSILKKPTENPTPLTKGVEILNRNLYLSRILSQPFAAILEPSVAQRYLTRAGVRSRWGVPIIFYQNKVVITQKTWFLMLRNWNVYSGCNFNSHIEIYLENFPVSIHYTLPLPSKVFFCVESTVWRLWNHRISVLKRVLDWSLLI